MDFIFTLPNHPVYKSICKVLENTRLGEIITYSNDFKIIFKTDTSHFQNLNIKFEPNNLYVLNSPLLAFETWRAKLNNVKGLIVEEYYYKSTIKDFLARLLITQFKNYPFIAMTKRTTNFLRNANLDTFYIPPACKKRKGNKNRDIILSVSRLVQSKNVFFTLNLAKVLKKENFIIIGDGPLYNIVKKTAGNLNNVEIIREVENKEIFQYYGKAKVLIHPAFKDPIGFTVIESLSTSTPVLTTKNTGSSDFLPSKWLIKDFNIMNWITSINAINNEDYKDAHRIFDEENLNIQSKYFRDIGSKLKNYLNEIKDIQ